MYSTIIRHLPAPPNVNAPQPGRLNAAPPKTVLPARPAVAAGAAAPQPASGAGRPGKPSRPTPRPRTPNAVPAPGPRKTGGRSIGPRHTPGGPPRPARRATVGAGRRTPG